MKIKKIIITLLVLAGVVALGIKGKGLLEKRKEQVANEALPSVEAVTAHVVTAKQGTLAQAENYLARVQSDKGIKLSTKLAGFVEKVYVEESQHVKKGTILAQVDSAELHSNITAVKASIESQKGDVALARSIYNRNIKLYKVGGLAKEKLDLSKVALNAKKSLLENSKQKLNQLNHQLTYLQIRAPFEGDIDAIMLEEGDLAAAGKPILSMSNGAKKLIFSFSPTQENSIKKGKKVFIDNKEVGFIKAIYNTSQNGLVSAEVALTSTVNLPYGSSINIDVLTDVAQGCILPDNTILHKKDGTYVMEYKDKKFIPTLVNIKIQKDNSVLIDSCPKNPIAQDSEVKLAKLPAYKKINIIGENHE
jgi:RND family efflux transporter MFP subunit